MNSISPIAAVLIPLILTALSLNFIFLLNYTLRSKWRSTNGGKLFTYAFSLSTILLGLNAASYVFEDYPGREQVRFFIYGLFALNAIFANVVLILAQRKNSDSAAEFVRSIDPTFAKKPTNEQREIIASLRRQYRKDPAAFVQAPVVDTDK